MKKIIQIKFRIITTSCSRFLFSFILRSSACWALITSFPELFPLSIVACQKGSRKSKQDLNYADKNLNYFHTAMLVIVVWKYDYHIYNSKNSGYNNSKHVYIDQDYLSCLCCKVFLLFSYEPSSFRA